MSPNDLAEYLQIREENRFEDPRKSSKLIQKTVRFSYKLEKVMGGSVSTIFATSITLIQKLKIK